MPWRSKRCLVLTGVSLMVAIGWQSEPLAALIGFRTSKTESILNNERKRNKRDKLLDVLVENGVYLSKNFTNEQGIVPPFWEPSNTTSPCKPDQTTTVEIGPCFGTHSSINWEKQVQSFRDDPHVKYNKMTTTASTPPSIKYDWANHCRPGFLIIGAGKCGTSSLYHYLTEHPRVLPASEKQIHYFKYYPKRPMKWYLHHFPTATSFLSSGALMTGEASPGYLPYPSVVTKIRSRLPGAQIKIITIGRNPLERAYSSYRYNYVTPTTQSLQSGKIKGVLQDQNETYYEKHLFSFQDMMEAELNWLRNCLAVPHGSAVAKAREEYGSKDPWTQEFERRDRLGTEPLVDLDGSCYGGEVGGNIPRGQWSELMKKFPHKVIERQNVHLKQSFIGRSLYVLPLEWWYAVFDKSDLYFVCTEELQDMSGEPMNTLARHLGLPSFNFSSTVQKGAYNVGGHRGYDKEVSWTDFVNARAEADAEIDIPLTADFRREVEDFIRPYNERLFRLVGRRCAW